MFLSVVGQTKTVEFCTFKFFFKLFSVLNMGVIWWFIIVV
jgi:hypothetical protein